MTYYELMKKQNPSTYAQMERDSKKMKQRVENMGKQRKADQDLADRCMKRNLRDYGKR